MDQFVLRPWLDTLVTTHRVVYFDFSGNGRAAGHNRQEPVGMDVWVQEVVDVMDELSIGGATILGHSFGGSINELISAVHCCAE